MVHQWGGARQMKTTLVLFQTVLLTLLVGISSTPLTLSAPQSEEEEFDHYWSYLEMSDVLKRWCTEHGDIAKLVSIGRTYEGRELWAVKISDYPELEDDGGLEEEPDVLIMGAHHGNEWISYMVPLYLIHFLLHNYGSPGVNGTVATYLVDHREIWFVPMVNPDGVEYSRQTDRGWRKNREPNYLSQRGPSGEFEPDLVPFSYGTDLNRNYPWHWGELGGSDPYLSRSPTYPGPPDNKDDDGDALIPLDLWDKKTPLGPEDGVDEDPVDGIDNDGDGMVDEDPNGGFSTRETRAIRDLVEANSFTLSLSYHSYSELVIYPWGWTEEPTEDDLTFRKLAEYIAQPMGYRAIQGYDLYQTDGDSDDWLYGVHHVFAFTVELARSYRPPEEEIESISAVNLGGFIRAVSYAHNPYQIHLNMSIESRMVEDRVKVILKVENDRYPIPLPENPFVLHWVEGNARGEVPMVADGTYYAAEIPWGGGEVTLWIDGKDLEGNPLIYPLVGEDGGGIAVVEPSSISAWPEVHFTLSTVVAMLLILGTVWGGFTISLQHAVRMEREKSQM